MTRIRLRSRLVFTVAALAASPAPTAAADVHFGAIVGAGLTSFALSPAPRVDVESDVHPGVGGLLGVDLGPWAAFETRLVWIRHSVHWPSPFYGVSRTASARVDYLSVPLLVRLSVPRDGVRPYALAGGEISFKTGADLVACGAFSCVCCRRDFKPMDAGLAAGGGIEIPAGRAALFVEGLYSHGLVNVLDAPLEPGMEEAKTRRFVLAAGVRF